MTEDVKEDIVREEDVEEQKTNNTISISKAIRNSVRTFFNHIIGYLEKAVTSLRL